MAWPAKAGRRGARPRLWGTDLADNRLGLGRRCACRPCPLKDGGLRSSLGRGQEPVAGSVSGPAREATVHGLPADPRERCLRA